MTMARHVIGALLAIIGVWTAIGVYGPADIAGPIFAVISTVVIVVGATVLHVALKPEPFTSVTGGRIGPSQPWRASWHVV